MKKLKFCFVAIGLLLAGSMVTQCDEGQSALIAVKSVEISPNTLSLVARGAGATLTATVSPANASNKTVAWASSDKAVATVVKGVVIPKAAGTSTIMAISADGNHVATAQVTVTVPTVAVTGVSLTPNTLSLVAGGANATLTATVSPANASDKSVTWSSSNQAVATVVNGVVTPKTVGTATIMATSTDGNHAATAQVTVTTSTVAVTGVSLTPNTLSLVAGGADAMLTVAVSPANASDKTVTWASSNETVATVTNGVVTPKATGSTTITATSVDGNHAGTAQITVTATTVAVTGVSLTPNTLSLVVGGGTATLKATVTPVDATDKRVAWASSEEAVATVANGVVTPKATGSTTITATTNDGNHAGTAQITVTATTVAVTGVSLTPNTLSLVVGGETATLKATVTPVDATDKRVAWISSEEAVATVANGVVTPKATGSTTITATTNDGNHIATTQITVTASAVAVTGISLDPYTLSLVEGGATATLTATVTPADATDKTVTWVSSDEAVATVANGVVTPKTVGITNIKATTTDGKFSTTVQVTVTAAVAVTGVSLIPNTLSLVAGGATETLTATVTPVDATDKTVTWTSNEEAVATVANGVVTPKTVGTTTITATSADGNHVGITQITVTAAVAVTGVSLAPGSLSLIAGGSTTTLTATVTPADATDKTVTWVSSEEAVATVANGVVTPKTAGTTIITATTNDGNHVGITQITVTAAVAVTGVSLTPNTLSLVAGRGTATLTATVAPADASDKTVTWVSSEEAVATVANGVVTPKTAGTTTITATTNDGNHAGTAQITVTATTVAVTGVSLTPNTLSLIVGGATATLTATVAPVDASDKTVTWTSSEEAVATVANGVVTPKTAGTTTITATTNDGNHAAIAQITVTATTVAVTGVSLTPNTLSLVAGGATATLTATVAPADASDKTVTWASSEEAVATVANGVVTPKTGGTTTITATSVDGDHAGTAQITVTVPTVAVTGVSLTPNTLSLVVGGTTATLTATVAPANASDKTVTWVSSDEVVATVANGVVTPKTAGTTTITATSVDGDHAGTAQITVTVPTVAVTGVSLTPNTLSLVVGGTTATLTATVAPANASDKTVTWVSSDEVVATVANGVVTPKTEGTTTITATSVDGDHAGTAQITVTVPTVAVTGVSLTPNTLSLVVGGTTATLTATVAPANASDKTVTWVSSDEVVATVANGVVTPKTEGTTTITATTNDGNHAATAQVTVMTPFVSVWATTYTDSDIALPLVSDGNYNFTVDWGDGTTDTLTSWDDAKKTHNYTSTGDHTVTISGDISGWSFLGAIEPDSADIYSNSNARQLKEIRSWGSLAFGNTFGQFAGATRLAITATGTPDLTNTTSLRYCFLRASGFNSPVNSWNTNGITDMSGMFQYAVSFNQALSKWSTGEVTDISYMFYNATAFNGDISDWDTGAVTNMGYVFSNASVFNGDISDWDTSAVTDMRHMFFFAAIFSQDLSGWDVDEVTNSASFSFLSKLTSDQLPNFQ